MRRYDEELLRTLQEYIIDYQKLNGSSPTYRKIANRFPTCFSSTSKVKNYLSVLSDRGLIERAGDGSIKVDKRFRTEAVNAPLVGQVACGEPIEAYENIEGSFVLPAELYGRGELMLLKADGESMKNVGIDDGDYIVIRKQDTAEYGDMVLAIIGTGGTVKTFYPQENGTIILHPENEHYKDIIVEECLIQGVVVGCMKRYR